MAAPTLSLQLVRDTVNRDHVHLVALRDGEAWQRTTFTSLAAAVKAAHRQVDLWLVRGL